MPAELLRGVPAEAYHRDLLPGAPHFSRGVALDIVRDSALHAWQRHPCLGGAPVEDAEEDPAKRARIEAGSLIHALLLGGGLGIAVVEADSWRTNKAKDEREEARQNGLLPVLAPRCQDGLKVAGEIKKRLYGLDVPIEECIAEGTILWSEPPAVEHHQAIHCKARLDLLHLGRGMVWDLKVGSRINPPGFERSMRPFGYDIQSWLYPHAVAQVHRELAGRLDFEFLLCERRPPYDVAIVPVGAAMASLGGDRWNRALKTWRQCLASGVWPGHGRRAPVLPKPWDLEEEFTFAREAAGEPTDW